MKKQFLPFLIIILINLSYIHAQSLKLSIKEIYTNRNLKEHTLTEIKWIKGGEKFTYIKYDKNGVSLYRA